MTDEAQATQSTEDPVAETLLREQVRIEDAAIELARLHGWCTEIDDALRALFGQPSWPNPENAFTHSSDGRNCQRAVIYDHDGYNRLGYSRDGYDRDGYNEAGYDRHRFNREGFDADGIHRDAPERFRYNTRGVDAEGYDTGGYDRYGYPRGERPAELDLFNRDRDGYDAEGYDAQGYDRDGYDRDGYNRRGYDREGYNAEGRDRNGRDRDGINVEGLRRGTDEVARVADQARWQRTHGDPATGGRRPEYYGYRYETPDEARQAEEYWRGRSRVAS